MVSRMNEPRRRGRPVELDLDRVAHVALDMFREQGYDAVTMEDIARVVGHSRRTIFRHFPAKASLVWAGTERFIGMLQAELAAADPELSAIDAVRTAYVAASRIPDEYLEMARQRLCLIGDNHTLHSDGVVRFKDAGRTIQQVFIDREGIDPQGVDAAMVGETVALAAHEAFVWWARHGEGQPGPVIDAVLARLGSGLQFR